jgi:hypothetical protein
LQRERYGPDVIDKLSDDILTGPKVGMTHGDAIRLKRGCASYFNHSHAHTKQPRRSSPITSPSQNNSRRLRNRDFRSPRSHASSPSMRRRLNGSTSGSGRGSSPTPSDKGTSGDGEGNDDMSQVRYELLFPEGGSVRYYGVQMVQGDSTPADSHTRYFNTQLSAWIPVSPGYCAPAWSLEGREGFDDPFAPTAT